MRLSPAIAVLAAAAAATVITGCSSSSGPSKQDIHGVVEYDAIGSAPCRAGQPGWQINLSDGSGKILQVITTTAPVAHQTPAPNCTATYNVEAPKTAVYQLEVQDIEGFDKMTVNASDLAGGKAVPRMNGLDPLAPLLP